MKDLIGAMTEEKLYIFDRINNVDTSFVDRLATYGYKTLDEYFIDKREYLFNEWKPKVYFIDVKNITMGLEEAIKNKQYGIYLSYSDGIYAFHGTEPIDYELCSQLGICVAELFHNGGTIIGSSKDLGIEIVAPASIDLNSNYIMENIHRIISKYIEGAIIDGNDILVDGEKVMGSMQRKVDGVFVWAAQFSFEDHSDIISQICKKQSTKKPGYINSTLLSRGLCETEVLRWLQKQ